MLSRVRLAVAVLTAILVTIALTGTAQAVSHLIDIPWDPQTTDGSTSDFDNATMTFAAFHAYGLDITGPDSPGFHDHTGGGTTATIELHLNGVWTTVFSQTTSSTTVVPFAVPTIFPVGYVSGIRLSSIAQTGNTYHGWTGATNVTLFPEPRSTLLFAVGALVVGVAVRKKAVA